MTDTARAPIDLDPAAATSTLPPPPPPRSTTDSSTSTPASGPTPRPASDRLVRPRGGRRIGGVCAGIADRFGWSRTTVRVLSVVSILLPGPQVLAYLILWIAIPNDDD